MGFAKTYPWITLQPAFLKNSTVSISCLLYTSYRGQRGRMEIRVDVKGVSCHGSAPERGDNAIYKMADILQDVRALNENDAADDKEVKGLVKMLDEKYNPEYKDCLLYTSRCV